jgi:putative tRNA adenosine deaminase-associated protein
VSEQFDDVDFALAAFRQDGAWHLRDLAAPAVESVTALTAALGRLPHDDGAIGMVAVDQDFFLLVRVDDTSTRLLLSDASAAEDWDLAQSALDYLALPAVDDEAPAGDLDLFHDLGFHTMDMAELLEDADLFPDEALAEIAQRLGFGDEFDDALGDDDDDA